MLEIQVSSRESIVQSISTFRVEVASGNQKSGYQVIRLYFLEGALSADEAIHLSKDLLADPVTETFTVSRVGLDPLPVSNESVHSIEVTLLPGVTDPAAENLLRAAPLLGIGGLQRAATGQRHLLTKPMTPEQLQKQAAQFSNAIIQRFTIDQPITPPFVPFQQTDVTVEIILLRGANDDELLLISGELRLALHLAEMQAIRSYFEAEDRDPSDAELEMVAQTWSEHCVHKTFKTLIDYSDADTGETQTIDGLLRTYIRAATERINTPWVHSAFVDNAGIVAFDDVWDLAFKVETHNHPSALERFGGANTGVGGVVRDILGVSARPIANTDVLCFGLPDTPELALPEGTLYPQRIVEGVVHGVEDYGNKMGIPTVNGAVLYHPGYGANPLVFYGLVRSTQGCYDAAVAYGAPFISGKDSLNNEYNNVDGTRHTIPGTLLISTLGIVPEVGKTVTTDLKTPGNLLYTVGDTRAEFGGSHFRLLQGLTGGSMPQCILEDVIHGVEAYGNKMGISTVNVETSS